MKKERPVEDDIEILKEKNTNMIGMIVPDPMGSYTGRPIEKWELPVQDADDL